MPDHPGLSQPDRAAPPGTDAPARAQSLQKVYNQSVSTSLRIRSGPEILSFFDGLELLGPGLVSGPEWRAGPAAVARGAAGRRRGLLAGVGRRP